MPATEATPTRQFLHLTPVWFTDDIPRTIRYYEETLGFQMDFDYGDPVFYAAVSCGGLQIHLRHLDQPPAKEEREADLIDLYVTVADMDRLYSEMVGRGAKIVYGPVEQEYGMKEFYVEDCNGYRLAFGQPTEGN